MTAKTAKAETNEPKPVAAPASNVISLQAGPGSVVVPLSVLKTDVFVRSAQPSEDRVRFFKELYVAGHPIPPIKIAEGPPEVANQIVDGRTRFMSLMLLSVDHAVVEYVKIKNTAELIVAASLANEGGAQPSTRADRLLIIDQLLSKGWKVKKLCEAYGEFWGIPAIKELIRDAESEKNKRRMREAKKAVIDGDMRLEQAAVEHNVNPETLRTFISGERADKKKSKYDVLASTGTIGNASRAYNSKIGVLIRDAIKSFDEGGLTFTETEDVIKKALALSTASVKRLEDQLKRFRVRNGTPKTKTKK